MLCNMKLIVKHAYITGVNSEEVGNVRNIECHMFRGILDYVTTQLDTPTSRILPFTRAFGTKGE